MTSILPFEQTRLGRALVALESSLFQIQARIKAEVPSCDLTRSVASLAEHSIESVHLLRSLILEMGEQYRSEATELVSAIAEKLEATRAMNDKQLSEAIETVRSTICHR